MAAPARGIPAGVRVASRLKLGATFFPDSSTFPDQSNRRGRYRQRGPGPAGPPPAMMAEVRVVIRRHIPLPAVFVGPGGGGTRTAGAEKVVVAEDIALRRRRSRALLTPERVERALAEDVLPLIRHKFDRGAVAAASREICAYVSATCADQRLARAGVHVLILLDTFACPPPTVVFRVAPPSVPPCKLIMPMTTMQSGGATKRFIMKKPTVGPCMELESRRMPPVMKETRQSSAVIVGDGTTPAASNPIMELKIGTTPLAKGTTRPSVGVIGDGRPPKPVEERFKGWLPW